MNNGICSEVTCPWWLLPTFDNPLRQWLHPAEEIIKPFVREGDVVLEPGCGQGYFTIPLARKVGPSGKVIAVDLQEKMLSGLRRRANRNRVSDRIRPHLCSPETLGVTDPVDFVLAFWMVHEVGDRERFLREIHEILRPGGRMLVVEPRIHVTGANFERTLTLAWDCGFRIEEGPATRFSRSAVLVRN